MTRLYAPGIQKLAGFGLRPERAFFDPEMVDSVHGKEVHQETVKTERKPVPFDETLKRAWRTGKEMR